jgi:glycosyltransferase involved in cell wall biosynthesis
MARQVVVMVATSYPRFPGDGVGSFMEPIAKGVAARGHEVHLVAPWHPAITRGKSEDGVFFHFFHYAPLKSLNVFGYAAGLRADVTVRWQAFAVAPLALASGWWKAMRVATKRGATVMHGHWVVPGGAIAARALRRRSGQAVPLIVSLHGSDVFMAERNALARRSARRVFARAAWVTACSDDLRVRALALGADPTRIETLPYGVDLARFAPDEGARTALRREHGLEHATLVFAAGRLVRKKGFEYLIDAAREIGARRSELRVVIAGEGDLAAELAGRARTAGAGADGRPIVQLIGARPQSEIARWLAAADVAVIPSVHDDAGNVDGLPNTALEALASATPVVATRAGGLPQAIDDGVEGRLVSERDAPALARAIDEVLSFSDRGRTLGAAARARMARDFSWGAVAARLEAIYDAAARAPNPIRP